MWPFSSYPESTASDVSGQAFDYIVVGGGTAGCLIANRLSASNASVLVLDKGRVNAGLLSRIPLLGPLQRGINRHHAEPNANLRGRHVQLLAGEMLGGTSRIHSMVWSPGGRPEFDGWARDLGLDEWSWEKVEPALARVEQGVQRRQAGDTGLMPYVDSVMERVGLGPGGGRGTQRYARSELSIDGQGERSSALTSWLDASVVKERGGRLTVCTGVLASKLEFGDDGTSVTGVWIRPAGGGEDVLVKAQREVIICSGVFGTPQLLMLSGIGPKDHLSAQNIPIVQEHPAVGSHLITHVLVPVMTQLPRKYTLHIIQTVAILWHFLLWLFSGTGVLSSNGQFGAAFLHSTSIDDETMALHDAKNEDAPDLEVLICPLSTLIEHGVPGVPCMTWYAALVQPCTTGSIELTSGLDPKKPLKIKLPLLVDPHDSPRLRKIVRFAMRLASEFASPENGYPHPAPFTLAPGMDLEYLDSMLDKTKSKNDKKKLSKAIPPPMDAWKTVTDEEVDEYIKRVVTGSYDPMGTCRMSLTRDDGVVDQHLKVHGVRNLRIADASVFPRPGGASISASVYMIAERCAQFILDQN
ncbi:Glucose-methanol-choline oxidoreductase [Penicillium brevicompactum]|uniref:Glucose-methanol-choline oxidoreductase n=1 Tax=Penicillium brevicompactum TaxID=5074 RepID=A0A9W9UIG0_PENBR|nr:Glucose-methanol-choline oxidoreductase [Penicillium brevicompactum]